MKPVQYAEFNVVSLGLISVQSKIPHLYRMRWHSHCEHADGGISCVTTDPGGIPHGLCGDVLAALLTESVVQDHPSATLSLTLESLLGYAGLASNGLNYQKAQRAIDMLTAAKYTIEHRWRTPLLDIQEKLVLSVIDKMIVRREVSRVQVKGKERIHYDIRLNDAVYDSARQGMILATDVALLRELGSPTTRGVYRVFEALRREAPDQLRPELVIDAHTFADAARLLTPRNHISQRLEALSRSGGAFSQLREHGYLDQVDTIGSGARTRLRFRFGPDRSPFMDPGAYRLLQQYGVAQEKAAAIASTHRVDEVECGAWLIEQKKSYKTIHNPSGYLIQLLKTGAVRDQMDAFRAARKARQGVRAPRPPVLPDPEPAPQGSLKERALRSLESLIAIHDLARSFKPEELERLKQRVGSGAISADQVFPLLIQSRDTLVVSLHACLA